MYLCGVFLLGGCAITPGPGYEDVMARAVPMSDDAVRIVLLRPKNRDDGSSGGAASIELNQQLVAALFYGGFYYVDVPSASMALTAFGRFRAFGACEIEDSAAPGSKVYIDAGIHRLRVDTWDIPGKCELIFSTAPGETLYSKVDPRTESFGAFAAGDLAARLLTTNVVVNVAGSVSAVAAESYGRECGGAFRTYPVDARTEITRLGTRRHTG